MDGGKSAARKRWKCPAEAIKCKVKSYYHPRGKTIITRIAGFVVYVRATIFFRLDRKMFWRGLFAKKDVRNFWKNFLVKTSNSKYVLHSCVWRISHWYIFLIHRQMIRKCIWIRFEKAILSFNVISFQASTLCDL